MTDDEQRFRVYAKYSSTFQVGPNAWRKIERLKDFTVRLNSSITTEEGRAEASGWEDWALQWCSDQVDREVEQCKAAVAGSRPPNAQMNGGR